jgi:hypothetical protein
MGTWYLSCLRLVPECSRTAGTFSKDALNRIYQSARLFEDAFLCNMKAGNVLCSPWHPRGILSTVSCKKRDCKAVESGPRCTPDSYHMGSSRPRTPRVVCRHQRALADQGYHPKSSSSGSGSAPSYRRVRCVPSATSASEACVQTIQGVVRRSRGHVGSRATTGRITTLYGTTPGP